MSGFRTRTLQLIQACRRRAAVLVPVVIYGVAVACFVRDSHSLFDFPLDDGWIHRVYSRSLSQGRGFAYNDRCQEAGATSPLWCIVTAPAHWAEPLGIDVVVCLVKVVGILLGLATVLATAILTKRVSGSAWAGCIAASMFALEPRLLFSALSGMETVLLVAIWTWACVALLQRRFVLSMVLLGLAPLARPEAVVLLPFCLLAVPALIQSRRLKVSAAVAGLAVVVPTLLWMSFCYGVTGHWLPNTYYVKAGSFQFGPYELEMAWDALSQHGFASLWIYPVGLVAFAALFVVVRKNDDRKPSLRSRKAKTTLMIEPPVRRAVPLLGMPVAGDRFASVVCLLMLVAAPLIYLVGVVGTRQIRLEGYYWTRWVDPASLMLTIPYCMGYGAVLSLVVRQRELVTDRLASAGGNAVVGRKVGLAALLALMACVPMLFGSFVERRWHLSADCRVIAISNVRMGKWIGEHTPPAAVVLVNDAGAIRYFGQRHTVDLLGLNNANIAFNRASDEKMLAKADWLAVFPRIFATSKYYHLMLRAFEPRFTIEIPVEEYTICDSTVQTLMVAYQRKGPTPLVPNAGKPPTGDKRGPLP